MKGRLNTQRTTRRTVVLIEKEELEGNEQPLPRVGDFWEMNRHRFQIVQQRLLATGAIQFVMKGGSDEP